MLVFHDDDTRAHAGSVELTGGRFVPCFENPGRLDAVVAALDAAGHERRAAESSGEDPILAVHDERLVRFLERAFALWVEETGEVRDALPVAMPTLGMRRVEPETLLGRLGYWCFDASTPITAGTWTSARASVDVAWSAWRAVASGAARVAFGACRPPGHHAGRAFFGGYCYLNATAVVAQAAIDAGARRVAVLDVDDHHGNGTQEIFWHRGDVLTISLHGDPRVSYPYFSGYADEVGGGRGEGFNHNYPLPRGCGIAGVLAALDDAVRRVEAFAPDLLVVPLGVDGYLADPIGARLALDRDGYRRIGERLARLGLPTVILLEGGYALDAIGDLVAAALGGFEGA
jgi:acetoin utilization deacetylase AcuC-like enzyme